MESDLAEAVRSTSAGLGLSASGSLTEAISEALAVLMENPLTAGDWHGVPGPSASILAPLGQRSIAQHLQLIPADQLGSSAVEPLPSNPWFPHLQNGSITPTTLGA